jgi:hypothetical protein
LLTDIHVILEKTVAFTLGMGWKTVMELVMLSKY